MRSQDTFSRVAGTVLAHSGERVPGTPEVLFGFEFGTHQKPNLGMNIKSGTLNENPSSVTKRRLLLHGPQF